MVYRSVIDFKEKYRKTVLFNTLQLFTVISAETNIGVYILYWWKLISVKPSCLYNESLSGRLILQRLPFKEQRHMNL